MCEGDPKLVYIVLPRRMLNALRAVGPTRLVRPADFCSRCFPNFNEGDEALASLNMLKAQLLAAIPRVKLSNQGANYDGQNTKQSSHVHAKY